LERDGKVLLYFKTQTAVRVGMLFAQADTRLEKAGNATALIQGLAWLEAILRGNGFREILFDSEGPELQSFAKQKLGFVETHGLLSRPLATFPAQDMQQRDVGTVPTSTKESGVTANVRLESTADRYHR
jgi:hypothetical protein